jgi:hypothetical protein
LTSRTNTRTAFELFNSAADCTLLSGSPVTLCGTATLRANGDGLQNEMSCNSDPFVEVAVYKGSADLQIRVAGGVMDMRVPAMKREVFDLRSGKLLMISDARFGQPQIDLFSVQNHALSAVGAG